MMLQNFMVNEENSNVRGALVSGLNRTNLRSERGNFTVNWGFQPVGTDALLCAKHLRTSFFNGEHCINLNKM
jgi:hypothetical protein